MYQSQSTLPEKQNSKKKREKEEIVPETFASTYSAVNRG